MGSSTLGSTVWATDVQAWGPAATPRFEATGPLSGVGTLTGLGVLNIAGVAVLSGLGTLTGTGQQSAPVTYATAAITSTPEPSAVVPTAPAGRGSAGALVPGGSSGQITGGGHPGARYPGGTVKGSP